MATLFDPLRIGNLQLRNRFMLSPMENGHAHAGGGVGPALLAFMTQRAKNDIALIMTGSIAVSADGRGLPTQLATYDDALLPGLAQLAAAVHDAGAKIGGQIYHAGRQATEDITGLSPVAPSAIPCALLQNHPREMQGDDFDRIRDAFVDSTKKLIEGGFDLIELHFAHGYLLHSFLSPHTNHRVDAYGGSLENRMRYPLAVLDAVVAAAAGRVPVTVRVSAQEYLPDGLGFEQVQTVCAQAVQHGAAAISVSAGSYDSVERIIQPMFLPQGMLVEYAAKLKQQLSVPVIVAGRLNDAHLLEDILEQGKADMVAIGRGFIADEQLVPKIRDKDYDGICYCIACNRGCIDRVLAGKGAACTVNPQAGYELSRPILPAKARKRVLVIGAGPGGLEAARIAALCGHDVTIVDKQAMPGGKLNLILRIPEKQSYALFRNYLCMQLDRLGVRFAHKEIINDHDVREFAPQHIILATGSLPVRPDIDGIELPHVCFAEDALLQPPQGDSIAIVGGGLAGVETARALAALGKSIHLFEMRADIAMEYGATYRAHTLRAVEEAGIHVHTQVRIDKILSDHIVYDGAALPIDQVVIATGYIPNSYLAKLLRQVCPVSVIGDAKKPRRVLDATSDAFVASSEIGAE